MAKDGNRLGTKPAAPPLREGQHADRLKALEATVAVLKPLNPQERTNILAAVAEFYGLSLTVEN